MDRNVEPEENRLGRGTEDRSIRTRVVLTPKFWMGDRQLVGRDHAASAWLHQNEDLDQRARPSADRWSHRKQSAHDARQRQCVRVMGSALSHLAA